MSGTSYPGFANPSYSGSGGGPPPSFASAFSSGGFSHHGHHNDDSSLVEDLLRLLRQCLAYMVQWWSRKGRWMLLNGAARSARQLRRNLVARRLLSFPHLIVAGWIFVLLWGERWVFEARVESCAWERWEDWVSSMNHLCWVVK